MNASTFALIPTILHWGIGALLAAAMLGFFCLFVAPGLRLGGELKRTRKALAALKQQGAPRDLQPVEAAMASASLRHCWDEFQDTLHGQQTLGADGTMQVSRWRATSTAGSFFTDGVLVDTRLRTEFFRHLPGILTGLGIIGTFSGLILGLNGFKVSEDATAVQAGLQVLLTAVGEAFLISATAIALAMFATFVEKVMVSRLYARVEALCALIDGLFDSGAGEEYLARLVQSSETAATQAQHMKDALVGDLKGILTELTERQTAMLTANNAQLTQSLGNTIADSLKGPLEEISGAVKQVSGQQGDAVNKLLTDVLAGFAARMENMFGGQLGGMNELLRQTSETMQVTAQRFEQLAHRIQEAGAGATDKMAGRMEAMLQTMAERQSEGNAQMSAFVEQLRSMMSQGTAETAELMQSTFVELSQTTSALVKQLEAQATASNADLKQSTQSFAEQTGAAVAQQGEQISELAASVRGASDAMRESVATLRTGVDDNVNRMSGAAERLHASAVKLDGSLQAMVNGADAVDSGIDDLTEAAKSLNAAVSLNQKAISEQKEVRDALGTMVAELRRLVESASRDASVNAKLVSTLEGAAGKLVDAQREADTYLGGVTDTLAKAHEAFANTISSTLQRGNADFHKELARAVGLLRDAIQDFGDTLDSAPVRSR